MFQKLKDNLKETILRARLRRALAPDRQFLKSARGKFLDSLILTHGAPSSRIVTHQHIRSWRYALIAALVVFSTTGGLVVFADSANVSATHPLYQFKRFSEDVRLGLSSPTKQVSLHQEFARRRLHEIEETNGTLINNGLPIQPSSASQRNPGIIQRLNDDFRNELNQAINQSDLIDGQNSGDRMNQICNTLNDAVHQRALELRHGEHLEQRCAMRGGSDSGSDDN